MKVLFLSLFLVQNVYGLSGKNKALPMTTKQSKTMLTLRGGMTQTDLANPAAAFYIVYASLALAAPDMYLKMDKALNNWDNRQHIRMMSPTLAAIGFLLLKGGSTQNVLEAIILATGGSFLQSLHVMSQKESDQGKIELGLTAIMCGSAIAALTGHLDSTIPFKITAGLSFVTAATLLIKPDYYVGQALGALDSDALRYTRYFGGAILGFAAICFNALDLTVPPTTVALRGNFVHVATSLVPAIYRLINGASAQAYRDAILLAIPAVSLLLVQPSIF